MNRARGVWLTVAALILVFSVCDADAKSKNDGRKGKSTSSESPSNLNASDKARSLKSQPRFKEAVPLGQRMSK
jgi:hypothetical protein